jgi:hypothetical protein
MTIFVGRPQTTRGRTAMEHLVFKLAWCKTGLTGIGLPSASTSQAMPQRVDLAGYATAEEIRSGIFSLSTKIALDFLSVEALRPHAPLPTPLICMRLSSLMSPLSP